MEQIVQHTSQVQPDYLDNLLPGYRFCPRDSELIVYYLKRKIETGVTPKSRIYEVNLYNYSPAQLAGNHRACDDKWYFLTSRERKYAKGDVPNRKTGDFGLWKTTQKYTPIYDDATGRQVIGRKRSLAYYVKKDCKTPWLMHEYTMDAPNLPVGSGKKVLTEWVLCTIYKKKKKTTDEAPHQVFAGKEVDFSLRNSTGEYQQNQSIMSIPTNSNQLSHGASASTSINPHAHGASSSTLFELHAPALHPLAYASPVSQPIVTTTNSNFQFSNGASSSTPFEPYTHQGNGEYQQNQSTMSITANSSQLLHVASVDPQANGASSSTLFKAHLHPIQPLAYASPVSQPIVTTTNSSFQLSNGASSSTPFEPYTHQDAQPPACTSPLTSIKRFRFSDESLDVATQQPSYPSPEDVPMDYYDHFFQHDDYGTTGLVTDEDIMDFDVSKYISYEELLGPQSDP